MSEKLFKNPPNLVPVFTTPEIRHWGDDRHESWLELFYDLIFVAAVFQLGHFIVNTTHAEHGVDVSGFFSVVLIYFILYDTWMQHTLYTNLFFDSSLFHLIFYAWETVCFAFMALFLHAEHHAAESDCSAACGPGTQCLHDVCQIANNTLTDMADVLASSLEMVGQSDDSHGDVSGHVNLSLMSSSNYQFFSTAVGMAHVGYAVVLGVTAFFLLEGRKALSVYCMQEAAFAFFFFLSIAFKDNQSNVMIIWCCAFLVKVVLASFASNLRRSAGMKFHTHHLIARHGILMMISLGESILQIVIAQKSKEGNWYKAAAGFATMIVFMLAFSYFHTQPHDPKEHVASREMCFAQTIWFGLHPLLAFSYICVGIGMEQIFEYLAEADAEEELPATTVWLFCCGVCVALSLTTCVRLLHKGLHGGSSIRRYIMYALRFLASFSVLTVPYLLQALGEARGIYLLILNCIAIALFCLTDIGRDVGHHSHEHKNHSGEEGDANHEDLNNDDFKEPPPQARNVYLNSR